MSKETGVSLAAKCTCGKSISGICNGKGSCQSGIIWSDFVNKHNISSDEEQYLQAYLRALRVMPHLDDLEKMKTLINNMIEKL